MRRLCAVVLALQVLVIALAIPVAINLKGVDVGLAWGIWGGLALAALLLALLQHYRWAFYAGSVLQVAFLLSGIMVPAMLFLGAAFTGLWIWAIMLGRRTDAMQVKR